jgi:hypothetical protein
MRDWIYRGQAALGLLELGRALELGPGMLCATTAGSKFRFSKNEMQNYIDV